MTCDLIAVPPADLERLAREPEYFTELLRYNNPIAKSCSLEKAWHGLHYLLTGQAWDTTEPLGFIVAGGQEIDDSDGGYGPARLFTPQETRQFHSALLPISEEQLWSRFDPEAMQSQGVYPIIWDEPEEDLKDEYTQYFRDAKQFIADAAAAGQGLIVTLG